MKQSQSTSDIILLLVELYRYSELTVKYNQEFKVTGDEVFLAKAKSTRNVVAQIVGELSFAKHGIKRLIAYVHDALTAPSVIVLDNRFSSYKTAFEDLSRNMELCRREDFLSDFRSMIELPEDC